MSKNSSLQSVIKSYSSYLVHDPRATAEIVESYKSILVEFEGLVEEEYESDWCSGIVNGGYEFYVDRLREKFESPAIRNRLEVIRRFIDFANQRFECGLPLPVIGAKLTGKNLVARRRRTRVSDSQPPELTLGSLMKDVAAGGSVTATRDNAVCALLFCGLHPKEIVDLDMNDVPHLRIKLEVNM